MDLNKVLYADSIEEEDVLAGPKVPQPGKFAHEYTRKGYPQATISAPKDDTISGRLGLGFLSRNVSDKLNQASQTMASKFGGTATVPEGDTSSPLNIGGMLLHDIAKSMTPNVQDVIPDPSLTTAEKTLKLASQPVAGFFLGEDPGATVVGASEGNPWDVAQVALGATMLPGVHPLRAAGKGLKLLGKPLGKIGSVTKPVQAAWDRTIDKWWKNSVNYLTVPSKEESMLWADTFPKQFKVAWQDTMRPIQKGGKTIREALQPAVERLNPAAQAEIRKAKAQTSILTQEEERIGGLLAGGDFTLKEKTEYVKAMRGSSLRGISPKVKELIKDSRARVQGLGVDPIILKAFNEKKASLYTKMLEAPQDVLSSPHTKQLMETIDASVPDDTWFKQAKIRSAIGDAISDPGTSQAEAKLLIEMFQLPATTPEMALEASTHASTAYLKRSLLTLPEESRLVAAPGMPYPKNWVSTDWGGLGQRGYKVDPTLALELESYQKIQNNAKGVFSQYFTSPWKTMKIIMSPAAQLRNVFTNFMLNDIGGLPFYRMDVYAQAVRGMTKNHDTWKDFSRLTGGGGTFQHNELSQLATAWRYKTEFYDVPNKIIEQASKYPKEFYNANEQVFKFAKYLHNLEKGMGKAEAATDAIIPTFNYSEITPAVSYARTHLIPFATWTTKVIPYTFEMAVKHPVRVAKWFAMYQGIQSLALQQAGIDDEEWEEHKKRFPEYMKRGVYMLLPWRDSKGRLNMADLTYMVPGVGDMQQMLGYGLWGTVLQHPAITLPADYIRNKKFSGEPIVYDWQTPGVRAQRYASHAWESVFPSWFGPWGTDYKRYVKALSDQPGAMTMGQAIASQFGGRVQPIDPEQQMRLKSSMRRIHMMEITNEMNKELRLTTDPEKQQEIYDRYSKIRQRFIQEDMGYPSEEE